MQPSNRGRPFLSQHLSYVHQKGNSVKVEPLFHLGQEEELTAVLEEIIVINPHTPLKAFLNCLRRDRDKAAYQLTY